MGRRTKTLREIIGLVKDKASFSKALLLSNSQSLSLHLAILRVTTHSTYSPSDERHLAALLSLGDSSRATASLLIQYLMDRLHRTGDVTVALKSLITIHHIIKRGPFILQDQLSIFPITGGRNYLNLSAFHDGGTAVTLTLSSWVRFYARYLETLLSTSRTLGFFLGSSSSSSSSMLDKNKQEQRLSSFLNGDLVQEIDSLVGLIEEICKIPDNLQMTENGLVVLIVGLIDSDHLSAVNECLMRLSELKQRLVSLSFGESVELSCILKRIEDCRRKIDTLFPARKTSSENLWVFSGEMKEEMAGNVEEEEVARKRIGRREKMAESTRFEKRDKSVRLMFGSGEFSLMVIKT
ncbi:putative clathrin assembly protein At4g40080 [Impatiens glandulifera]|uniref:putative clathrin assembly protein At4g40080 n=1 Tax=Impatiens glandulifera TaxID=253017 RepID=UPI001FB13B8C|nr:putative clathrin assembly protein At4g40080 [Impatiens glandulifera]